jgi:hypothetical protein
MGVTVSENEKEDHFGWGLIWKYPLYFYYGGKSILNKRFLGIFWILVLD